MTFSIGVVIPAGRPRCKPKPTNVLGYVAGGMNDAQLSRVIDETHETPTFFMLRWQAILHWSIGRGRRLHVITVSRRRRQLFHLG